jgi:hypothetical protein
MAVVVFDPAEFKAAKPQFAELTDAQLEGSFAEACLLLDNSDASPVPYDPPGKMDRKTVYFLIVCHLATLAGWSADGRSGPVASASEGSVSVSYAQLSGRADEGWWNQTPCGAAAWAILSRRVLGGFYVGRRRPHPWG